MKEQLALLKLNLAGLPREHYDSLKDSEKTTLKATLDGLEAKIDTPQAAEIAKRTLALLRQGPTESVHGFATRLVPNVRASMPGAPEIQIQERMKEALLEKMNDNLHFLVRISRNYDSFDELRMKAQELEMMLKTSKSPPFINALQNPAPPPPRTIQENPRRVQFEGQARLVAGQTPPGRFENWAPRDAAPRSTPNAGRRFNPPPRQPTYDRNWRGRSTAMPQLWATGPLREELPTPSITGPNSSTEARRQRHPARHHGTNRGSPSRRRAGATRASPALCSGLSS